MRKRYFDEKVKPALEKKKIEDELKKAQRKMSQLSGSGKSRSHLKKQVSKLEMEEALSGMAPFMRDVLIKQMEEGGQISNDLDNS